MKVYHVDEKIYVVDQGKSLVVDEKLIDQVGTTSRVFNETPIYNTKPVMVGMVFAGAEIDPVDKMIVVETTSGMAYQCRDNKWWSVVGGVGLNPEKCYAVLYMY